MDAFRLLCRVSGVQIPNVQGFSGVFNGVLNGVFKRWCSASVVRVEEQCETFVNSSVCSTGGQST